MLAGAKSGNVDRKATSPEMKSTVKAYEVDCGRARICAAGLERIDRYVARMRGSRRGPKKMSNDWML